MTTDIYIYCCATPRLVFNFLTPYKQRLSLVKSQMLKVEFFLKQRLSTQLLDPGHRLQPGSHCRSSKGYMLQRYKDSVNLGT